LKELQRTCSSVIPPAPSSSAIPLPTAPPPGAPSLTAIPLLTAPPPGAPSFTASPFPAASRAFSPNTESIYPLHSIYRIQPLFLLK
jgi:hypothetical protein